MSSVTPLRPLFFRDVEGVVHAFDKLAGRFIGAIRGNPERYRDPGYFLIIVGVTNPACFNRQAGFLSHRTCTVKPCLGKRNEKCLAAMAGRCILPFHAGLQSFRHGANHLVAKEMAILGPGFRRDDGFWIRKALWSLEKMTDAFI
ncbi:MAG: hypothetical protein JNM42_13895 [Propionivibrio sp.]|uniref:hypothetical protein n=1 Tax=Propionivibrio sp. TaxID=2212460 RepID=UPI001A3B21D4|nr:hypothetical protein [Propionivibrio sp.]MBL8415526.1 hypothetical protein [Propionivibrio sp.]